MHKPDLALDNPHWLICHTTQPTNQPTIPFHQEILILFYYQYLKFADLLTCFATPLIQLYIHIPEHAHIYIYTIPMLMYIYIYIYSYRYIHTYIHTYTYILIGLPNHTDILTPTHIYIIAPKYVKLREKKSIVIQNHFTIMSTNRENFWSRDWLAF